MSMTDQQIVRSRLAVASRTRQERHAHCHDRRSGAPAHTRCHVYFCPEIYTPMFKTIPLACLLVCALLARTSFNQVTADTAQGQSP